MYGSEDYTDKGAGALDDFGDKPQINRISVTVRIRPLNTREIKQNPHEALRAEGSSILINEMPDDNPEPIKLPKNRERQFGFDYVFDKLASQDAIYSTTTKGLVSHFLAGFNGTIFAYGATGAGKTFTMLGSPERPGIIPQTLQEIFEAMNSVPGKEFVLRIAFMEVYNENIKDLLSTEDVNLELREDPVKGVIVAGVTEILATTYSEVLSMLRIGNRNRTIESTTSNDVSSRSHAVLQMTVEHKEKAHGIQEEVLVGKLSMIDLAGSERTGQSNLRGVRMIEGANINKSLLALGNCINALSEASEKGTRNPHIPYRDSKLTRLLKDSLGGNCRTMMIANVSPSFACLEDTFSTLKYASRAKNITTFWSKNVYSVSHHVGNYAEIIAGLKKENEDLKRQLLNAPKGAPSMPISAISPQKNQIAMNPFEGIEKYRGEIEEHFSKEVTLKKKVYEMEDEVERMGLVLQRFINENQPKEKIDNQKKNIKEKMALIDSVNQAYNELIKNRSVLIAKSQSKELGKEAGTLLNAFLKQHQLNIENEDYIRKERKAVEQLQAKEQQIQLLQQQLQMREEILQSQKRALEANKLKTGTEGRGTLKSLDDLDESSKAAFTQPQAKSSRKTGLILPSALNIEQTESVQQYQVYRQKQNRELSNPSPIESPGLIKKESPKGSKRMKSQSNLDQLEDSTSSIGSARRDQSLKRKKIGFFSESQGNAIIASKLFQQKREYTDESDMPIERYVDPRKKLQSNIDKYMHNPEGSHKPVPAKTFGRKDLAISNSLPKNDTSVITAASTGKIMKKSKKDQLSYLNQSRAKGSAVSLPKIIPLMKIDAQSSPYVKSFVQNPFKNQKTNPIKVETGSPKSARHPLAAPGVRRDASSHIRKLNEKFKGRPYMVAKPT